MRFQQTASYPGIGQKDLSLRVAALASLGEVVTARNADHPQLFDRSAVLASEQKLGITWCGQHNAFGAGYMRGNEPVGLHGADLMQQCDKM